MIVMIHRVSVVLACCIAAGPLTAQTPTSWTLENTLRYRNVSAPAVSPDGALAAVTVTEPVMNGDTSRSRSTLHVFALDATPTTSPLWSEADASAPVWSPDGDWLAFASSRTGARNVWRARFVDDARVVEQVTDLDRPVREFGWSPDGRWLAFVAADEPDDPARHAAREASDVRVMGEGHRMARLYVTPADATGGTRPIRPLTPPRRHVGGHVGAGLDGPGFAWSPDGAEIVFTHSPSPLGDDWVHADVSIVDVATGAVRPLLVSPAAAGGVAWSPDGEWIALPVTDVPATYALTTRLHVISPGTGELRPLAESFDRRPSLIGWSADSRRVIISESRGVGAVLSALPVDGSERIDLSPDTLLVAGAALGGRRTIVGFVSEAADRPPEAFIASLDVFTPRQVTAVQPAVAPALPQTETIRWQAYDGTTVEGLLTYPRRWTPGTRAPLLVILHGGPPSVFTNGFIGRLAWYPIAVFAERGFAVLRPNVRGSSGYGRDFRYANLADWGGGDHRDVVAGIDALAERGIIDSTRVGIMGWSYGGYLTAISITRTTRFRAASVGAGITDLVSFSGTADIPGFVPSYYGGEFWGDPDPWLRDSPIHNIDRVTTPTLIQHGELDERVPLGQGLQLYHALRRRGVPVRMLIYPGQGHALAGPRFQLHAARENLEWFERWLR